MSKSELWFWVLTGAIFKIFFITVAIFIAWNEGVVDILHLKEHCISWSEALQLTAFYMLLLFSTGFKIELKTTI